MRPFLYAQKEFKLFSSKVLTVAVGGVILFIQGTIKQGGDDMMMTTKAAPITAKTAYGAAQQVAQFLRTNYEDGEADVIVRKNDDDGAWEVIWEGGPFEWTINLTAYGSPYGEGIDFRLQIPYGMGWIVECINGYTLGFYAD